MSETEAYLSDYAVSIKENFPTLESFTHLEDQTYRWQFPAIRYGGKALNIQFTTRFVVEPGKEIRIESIEENEATQLNGWWRFDTADTQTCIDFHIQVEGKLNLPFFLKNVVNPLAQKELKILFDEYIENVEKALQS